MGNWITSKVSLSDGLSDSLPTRTYNSSETVSNPLKFYVPKSMEENARITGETITTDVHIKQDATIEWTCYECGRKYSVLSEMTMTSRETSPLRNCSMHCNRNGVHTLCYQENFDHE
jgi:hypothetical protein